MVMRFYGGWRDELYRQNGRMLFWMRQQEDYDLGHQNGLEETVK